MRKYLLILLAISLLLYGCGQTSKETGNTNKTYFKEATPSANWEKRELAPTLSFDNKIWVLGGMAYSGIKNDVWYSSDGSNWIAATTSANWGLRMGNAAIVYDNKNVDYWWIYS